MLSTPSGKFPSTAWSVVRAAKDREGPDYLAAMNRCVSRYWKPVFYFVRAKGYAVDRAEDLTQEFFLQMLRHDWLRRADPGRGRFRTFLLTILTRFLSDQGPRRAPRQQVFDGRLVSVSALVGEKDRRFEPVDTETPEEVFMKQWARAVIANVRQLLQMWCHSRSRPDWYAIFCAIHFPPPGERRPTQDALSERFRLSRDQVRYGLNEANRQFVEFLRAEVADQVDCEADVEACYWACLVLAEIGPDADAAVPALAKLAQSDQSAEVRREAILALAAIGPKAAPAVGALIGVLGNDEVNVVPAVFALGAIGPNAKAGRDKVRLLADDENSPDVLQTVSLWTLARMNPNDEQLVRRVVPRLVDALKSPDPGLRTAAVRALIDLDPDPEIVRPLMREVMADADPEALDDILDAVASLGDKAVPHLTKALQYEEVRGEAAAAIARIGPPAKAAVPALVEALGDRNPETRSELLFAVAAIGPDAKQAVPAVANLLNDPDMDVRYAACYALGRIGPAAKPAKEELQRMLDAPDQFLAMASAWALARIHPECPVTSAKSVPVMIGALAEPNAMSRLHAAEALRCLGPLAKPATAALKNALQDEDEQVRDMAAEALKAIGS